MKMPSKRMPAAPVRKMSKWAWPCLGGLIAGLIYWIYCQPYVLPFLGALALLTWIQWIYEGRFRRQLILSRPGDSICTFARAFDRRADTWVLRAVYEEVSRYLSVDSNPVPVRKSDRWEEDLKIDPDDMDDLAKVIAFRAQRSPETSHENPLNGKVITVGDLVSFLQNQPTREAG